MELSKKWYVLGLSIILFFPAVLSAQTKKQPTIMVMPADQWMVDQGYYDTYEDPQSGNVEKVMDYKVAFQENQDVGLVISKIGEIFSDRGFPLRDMEQKLKQIEQDKALDAAEDGGMGTKATLKEKLLKQAKADIVLYLNWSMEKKGPYNQVTFQLDAVDPYLAEQVGAASGTGPKNSGNVDVLLQEAVLNNVTNLQSQMQDYFDDLNENGRKIRMRLKIANTSSYTLKDYCSGEEKYQIGQMFEDAVVFKSVNKSYRIGSQGETQLIFDMIRIPMFYERESAFGTSEVAMNATDFAEQIKTMIAEKCQVLTKDNISITGIGLGEASITLKPE